MKGIGEFTLVPLFLLLLLGFAAAGNPSAGLDKACDKVPVDPDFCELLLEPFAVEFKENDPKKMGFYAINATAGKVQALKAFLVSPAMKQAKSLELKEAIADCVQKIDRCEASLDSAEREFRSTTMEANSPRKLGKADPGKMIDAASADLKGCLDALKKSEGGANAAGGASVTITGQALRSANESVRACAIAKAFVVLP